MDNERPPKPRPPDGVPEITGVAPSVPRDAVLKLRMLDDELAAERRALEQQMQLVKSFCCQRDSDGLKDSYLLRLLIMLDHGAHLARRCIQIVEERRALLLANPRVANPGSPP